MTKRKPNTLAQFKQFRSESLALHAEASLFAKGNMAYFSTRKGSDVQVSNMKYISITGQFYTEINLSKID
jgi:hypothetical protein